MESNRAAEPVIRTIVFTDLVGSTTVAERMGDEHLVELLDTHDRIVTHAADRWHGEWIKSTGDGAMLAFRRADRAILGAIDVQRCAIASGLPLTIGADHGAVVRCDSGDLRGLVANVAARLADLARAGEIVLSERVVTAARFSGGELRACSVRGLSTRQRVRTLLVRNGTN